jgi:hypothetical protein
VRGYFRVHHSHPTTTHTRSANPSLSSPFILIVATSWAAWTRRTIRARTSNRPQRRHQHLLRLHISAAPHRAGSSNEYPLSVHEIHSAAFDMSSNPASRALTPSSSKIDLFTLHRSMAPSRSGAGERAPLLTQNGEGSARRNYTMELDASGGTDTSNAGVSGVTGMSGVSGVSGGALGSEEGGKDTPRDLERGDDREFAPVE